MSDVELSYKLGATAVKIVLNWKPEVIRGVIVDLTALGQYSDETAEIARILSTHNGLVEEMREIVKAFLPEQGVKN